MRKFRAKLETIQDLGCGLKNNFMKQVALIGYGYWGEKLARVIEKSSCAHLRWCCDISKPNLEVAKKLFPATNVTTQLYDILKDKNVSAVVIATPAKSHYIISKQALLAKKHVLVEKPITTTLSQVRELVSIAKKQKRILMTDHIFLFNSAIMKIKEMISKKELGNIYYGYGTYTGPGPIRSDTSVIWDLAIHFLYTFSYLLDSLPRTTTPRSSPNALHARPWVRGLPESVSAVGKSYLSPDVYDVAFLNLEYEKNIHFNLRVSWMDPAKNRSLVIVGDKKTIVFDDTLTDKIAVYDKRITPDFVFSFGDVIRPHLRYKEPLAEVFNRFIDCIESKEELIFPDNIVNIISLLEAAEYSLKHSGQKIKLNYDK